MSILIYGATGYTGQLIAKRAKEQGLSPILAGRNEQKTKSMAEELGFDWRAFELGEAAKLAAALEEVDVVLHVAGPFAHTYEAMSSACLAAKTHYLDVTGEIDVFEGLAARDAAAKQAGITLLPGCGFDVVPSDCLAAHVATLQPDAVSLDILVSGLGKTSRGTAKTAVESIGAAKRARRGGRIVDLDRPEQKTFDLGHRQVEGISVSWGDVSTAFHSTGVPDITVFFEATDQLKKMANMSGLMRRLLATGPAQAFLKRQIDKRPPGPSETQREKSHAEILAVGRGEKGEEVKSLLKTPDGYTLTAMTALAIAERVEAGKTEPGFHTPSQLFSPDFILQFDGCERKDLTVDTRER